MEAAPTSRITECSMIRYQIIFNYLCLSREDLNAVKAVVLLDLNNEFLALAGGFVHPHNAIQPPVGDVDDVFKDNQRKWMAHQTRVDRFHVRSRQVRVLDVIQ